MTIHKTILLLVGIGFCIHGYGQVIPAATVDSIPKRNLTNTKFPFNIDNPISLKPQLPPEITRLNATLKNELKNFNKQILKPGKTFFLLSSQADTSYTGGPGMYFRGDQVMNSEWTLAGIPLTFDLFNQSIIDDDRHSNPNVIVRFDKDAYLNKMKKNLAGKIDPSSLLSNLEDPLQQMKDQAIQSLRKDLEGIPSHAKDNLDSEIAGLLSNPGTLLTADIQSIKRKYLNPKLIRQLNADEALLANLRQRRNVSDSSQIRQLTSSISHAKAVQEMVGKVDQHLKGWKSNGLKDRIMESLRTQKETVNKLLSDPQFIRKQAKQKLNLRGLQKLFLNVNRLNLGRDALSISPMSFNHFLQTGISTEFLTNKGKSILLMTGKTKEFNSILDHPFKGNLLSSEGKVMAGRLGLGSTRKMASNISLSSFTQSLGNNFNLPINPSDLRKTFVTTLSNQLSIGKKGSIDVDLSKSATSYQQSTSTSDSTLKQGSNLAGLFSLDNLLSSTAIAVKYAHDNSENGLTYQFNFSRAANGYANPGNSFLNSGATEIGTQARKKLFKDRLQLSFRANIREYKYSDEISNKWRNSYVMVDVKWKMKKGQHIGLRYQPNRMSRIEKDSRELVTSLQRFTFESNLYRRLGKVGYRNYTSLSYQQNKYLLTASDRISNTSLQFNSYQTLSIGKNLVFANINLIKSNNHSAYLYFNSTMNIDGGYSYPIAKRIMASSGIAYSSVSGWYTQAGIRQSLSGQLSEKIAVSLFFDARKNLRMIQPIRNSPIRADLTLHYSLNNPGR